MTEHKTYPHLYAGREVTGQNTFLSRNSSDLNDVLGAFPEATRDQVREAAQAARDAFPAWSKTPAPIRGQVIGLIGQAIEQQKETRAQRITREMGKALEEERGADREGNEPCDVC